MPHFSQKDINEMHHLYRINLINSCSGYKSANLIGTKSRKGISNVAVFSSVTHIGSDPSILGFFLRPTTVRRNTYDNIKETAVFTINHIYEDILDDAHHTSAKYDATISEFDVTQLEEDYKNDFMAPFVKGSPVQMAMHYVEEYDIKANNTVLLIGEIKHLYIQEGLIEKDGFLNLAQGKIAAINGLDGYAIPNLKTRLEYQRPNQTKK
ncbi:flavin reductase (DIM6/NTAB) family NADH-FMN oxidoreductase RutF [Gelidibacter algens]|jgi:flavin reductase (DIM6/NTAB) family NADH-FMN oxidoreductase RutF|uniref:Flavin reductase (DIM6/NTAB) family NADH-FMN oxidoreductase RutF n=1 Tax=Gelidibacter algens TaxID=49280 RepID=A0A1A7QUH3_9FLAO|nr:flavin reductase [Gelidibacter algens]OBX22874.1 flavin oxidoreductase [Gelidibacter algens]RAJ27632.1 flavin reductase (DIM6/NTAB) family NADH-FMN oxidoreductase RutF [Gelidibacter algens]